MSDLLMPFNYWADRAEEAPDFMIDGWLHAETNIITGKPTVGKTRLVAAMAAAVARGDDTFGGSAVRKHGPVIVLSTDAGEAGRWGLRMREHRVREGVEIGRFRPGMWELYAEAAARQGCALLILDNVNGALRGDESISADAPARRLTEPLTAIAEAGTTVALVTHSAKNYEAGSGRVTPTGAMGSTVYEAFARGVVHMHDATEPNVRTVSAWSNDNPRRDVVLGVTWNRASAEWRPLKDTEDARPRTAERAHDTAAELYALVAGDPELRTIKEYAEIGRRLHAAGKPGPHQSPIAAGKAFGRAVKRVRGAFEQGAWRPPAAA